MKDILIKHFNQKKVFIFIIGIITGMLLGLYVKYPLQISEIQKHQIMCGPNSKIISIKVSVSGEVYEITCNDKTIHKIN